MHNGLKRTVMAVGAHADDIEIHVGGTLAKYHALGYEVAYVMSTNNMSGAVRERQPDGTMARWKETPIPNMERRKRECAAAACALGTTPIHLDHPQRHYHTGNSTAEVRYGCALPEGVPADVPTILTCCEHPGSIDALAELILAKNPECILTHGVAQRNIEHFATCLLVTNAFWKAVEKGFDGGLLHWREEHTLHGEYNCRWETFVDCTGYLDRKMELVGMHRCQMPDADAPDHGHRLLNQWRGKACGCEIAELFTWVQRPTRRDSIISMRSYPVYGELMLELIQNTH